MNHLGAIGLAPAQTDSTRFAQVVDSVAHLAREDAPAVPPRRHVRWTDPSGASLALHLLDAQVQCVTPFFEAPDPARWRVRTLAPHDDPECLHCGGADCDVLDEEWNVVTRATVQWLHFLPYRTWLGRRQVFTIELVAFAHEAAFYATSAAFEADQERGWPGIGGQKGPEGAPLRFAEEAFVPEGLFGGAPGVPDAATATFTGKVLEARALTNGLTGLPFQHVRIATLPGPIDVVVGGAGPPPAPGAIAVVRGWLVGRPEKPRPQEVLRVVNTALGPLVLDDPERHGGAPSWEGRHPLDLRHDVEVLVSGSAAAPAPAALARAERFVARFDENVRALRRRIPFGWLCRPMRLVVSPNDRLIVQFVRFGNIVTVFEDGTRMS